MDYEKLKRKRGDFEYVSEKQKTSEVARTVFIYFLAVILTAFLIVSFFPAYNVRLETSQLVLVLIIVVLLLFPYFSIIEILGFLKLSKEIKEIKGETKEIRQAQMALMQTVAVSQSAIASNVININPFIGRVMKDAEAEAETLLAEMPALSRISLPRGKRSTIRSETERIRLYASNREYIAAFALLRTHIENLVKDVLGVGQKEPRRFYELLKDAKKREVLRPALSESILSVRRFANAVVHMPPSAEKTISPAQVDKMIDLGMRVVAELESVKSGRTPTAP